MSGILGKLEFNKNLTCLIVVALIYKITKEINNMCHKGKQREEGRISRTHGNHDNVLHSMPNDAVLRKVYSTKV